MRTLRAGLAIALALVATLGAAAPPSATAPDVVAAVRAATSRYLDIARAREDGFVQASGMEPRHGYHFVRTDLSLLAAVTGDIDLARPPMLIYVERAGAWQLAGVEYALPKRPAVNPFPGAEWHEHEASCHYRDFREVPAARPSECPSRHPQSAAEFSLWHPALSVVHVWAWYPNPDGPYAPENAFLAPYGGAPPPGGGHGHARHPAELAYSQWTHRAAGGILVLLALITVWQSWRPRRFPWSALSAPFWIGFAVYLFPSSDPESWPWGPKSFGEIFTDPLVLQHKLLALIPLVIGVVEILSAARLISGARWRYVVPVLAVIGGVSLMAHFHEGKFHLDAIYLQHVVMGFTAVALGVTLAVVRRRSAPQPWFRWAWPGFLTAMGLVLLFYVER